jgi:hypothetical protein
MPTQRQAFSDFFLHRFALPVFGNGIREIMHMHFLVSGFFCANNSNGF